MKSARFLIPFVLAMVLAALSALAIETPSGVDFVSDLAYRFSVSFFRWLSNASVYLQNNNVLPELLESLIKILPVVGALSCTVWAVSEVNRSYKQ